MDKLQETTSTSFVSLGMVVLDELRLPNGAVLYDTIGGSGAYSTLGARLVTHPARAHEVGCFVLAGQDFPKPIIALLKGWDITVDINVDNDRLSTRGQLEYHDETFNCKSFRYLTAPLQPAPRHLPATLLSSRSFHMLLAPENVLPYIDELTRLRWQRGLEQRPLIVWEPLPAKCSKDHLDKHLQACGSVDVFSPNHLELLALFGEVNEPFNSSLIETCAARLLTPKPPPAVSAIVIRAAEHGCFLTDGYTKKWLPPFHSDADKVVDVTGGGNTFLGAFTTAFQRTRDLTESAIQASVAASFAIEQIGLATKTMNQNSEELWNGVTVSQKLDAYRDKLVYMENGITAQSRS
ncbi:Ribokinase-like protein [Biscogniauxia marginata]|nr:Ribokinase-like protein [Biscogniauxia marginata]